MLELRYGTPLVNRNAVMAALADGARLPMIHLA
jgi:hypothetical protein